jgi:DNA-binding FadR family transcriptional regulator
MRQMLADGKWIEGTRIPTELELAQNFDVSRPIVREALARLKEEGVIDSRRGSGSFVIKAGAAPVNGFRPIESIADLIRTFEFRLSIECDAAAYAAARRDANQLAQIEATAQAIGEGMSDDNFGDADFRFHLAIAEATGNAMFVTAMSMLRQQIVIGMRLASELAPGGGSRTAMVMNEHGDVVQCIAQQDSDGARAAMRDHLMSSRYRLLGSDVPSIDGFQTQ